MQEVCKALVEAQLIVKFVREGIIVHQLTDLFVAHARQISIALLAVHVVKAKHDIVIIARAVAHSTPSHTAKRTRLALTALFFDDLHHLLQSVKAHSPYNTGDIFDSRHINLSY